MQFKLVQRLLITPPEGPIADNPLGVDWAMSVLARNPQLGRRSSWSAGAMNDDHLYCSRSGQGAPGWQKTIGVSCRLNASNSFSICSSIYVRVSGSYMNSGGFQCNAMTLRCSGLCDSLKNFGVASATILKDLRKSEGDYSKSARRGGNCRVKSP